MKKFFVTLCVCLAMLFASAQKYRDIVLSKVALVNKAVFLSRDSSAIYQLASDDLLYGHSNGSLETKSDLLHRINEGKGATYKNFEAVTTDYHLSNNNTAVVRQVVQAAVFIDGKESKLNIAVLQVWEKKKNDWFLIARQAVNVTK